MPLKIAKVINVHSSKTSFNNCTVYTVLEYTIPNAILDKNLGGPRTNVYSSTHQSKIPVTIVSTTVYI